jgi:ribosomal protein S18 acetylase RimI-like enzyme
MVTVRPATPADAPGVARVHDAALRAQGADRYSDAELDAMAPPDRDPAAVNGAILAREERYVAVAEADRSGVGGGRVVGVGGVHLDDGRLLGVFVHPDRVGEGIGRALFEDIEARAGAAGLDDLTIHSALNAVGFYEAVGFERVGEASGRAPPGAGGPLGSYDTGTTDIRARVLRKEL